MSVADRAPAAAGSLEQRLRAAGMPMLPRLAWLEIDLEALAGNLAAVRRAMPGGVRIAAVVKADAYGHGLLPAARAFVDAGADRLCVATLDEGLALRAGGIGGPVLLLFPPPVTGLGDAAAAGLEVTVAADETVDQIARVGPRPGDAVVGPLRVHLEIESGLGRGGIRPDRVVAAASRLRASGRIEIAGTWTHLASAHDPEASRRQVERFEAACRALASDVPGLPGIRHVAASGGILADDAPPYEMVRPGLILYGLVPEGFPVAASTRRLEAELVPAMSVHARPVRILDIEPGEGVGYGSRWRADRPSRIATLPVGYGDGWSYDSAGRTEALVRGRRVPLRGSVAMDAIAADVTDVPGVGPEDEFVLLGVQGDERITALDLARARNTIPWEVVTAMAVRLARVYDAGGEVVGVRTIAGERWRRTRGT